MDCKPGFLFWVRIRSSCLQRKYFIDCPVTPYMERESLQVMRLEWSHGHDHGFIFVIIHMWEDKSKELGELRETTMPKIAINHHGSQAQKFSILPLPLLFQLSLPWLLRGGSFLLFGAFTLLRMWVLHYTLLLWILLQIHHKLSSTYTVVEARGTASVSLGQIWESAGLILLEASRRIHALPLWAPGIC